MREAESDLNGGASLKKKKNEMVPPTTEGHGVLVNSLGVRHEPSPLISDNLNGGDKKKMSTKRERKRERRDLRESWKCGGGATIHHPLPTAITSTPKLRLMHRLWLREALFMSLGDFVFFRGSCRFKTVLAQARTMSYHPCIRMKVCYELWEAKEGLVEAIASLRRLGE
ncbi:hypothetical protein PIB30_066838 [Stylosanthes scabra]|uniref:Uncharacterized protein n=1 Tax=Stylosanthes scabra TaxID=79078 RepID=A0ABU6QNH2_9FABA|nr:hypothetical protein [Stylosanthes scabra]